MRMKKGSRGIVVQLPAQVPDVDSKRGHVGLRPGGAEPAQQELVGDELAGTRRQQLEDLQLGGSQAHELTGVTYLAAVEVDLQVPRR